MVISTLAWNLVGPVPVLSGTKLAIQRSKQEFMSTLLSLINSSSYWQVDAIDVTGSFYQAFVVKPVSSSVVQDMRLLLTMNVTGSPESVMGPYNIDLGLSDTNTAGYLLMGITPSASNAYTTGKWLSAAPFGTNARWSKLWGMNLASTAYQQMYLIESQETLHVGVRGKVSAHTAIAGGALWQSYDSGSGETDQRVLGMISGGSAGITTALLQGGFFLDHGSSDNSEHAGCFVVSGGINTGPGNAWDICGLQYVFTYGAPSDTIFGDTTTTNETLVGSPISYYSNTAAFGSRYSRIVGLLRQAYAVQDLPGLLPVVTGVNSTVQIGLTLGLSPYSTNDALFLSNT